MDSPKTGLMPLGERIQAALEAETQPAEQLRIARVRLLDRVTGGRQRAPSVARRLRYGWLAAAALVLVVAVTQSWSRPISFTTGLGERRVGDVLEAARNAPLRVDFSEGSRMLLHANARARVLETQAAGARVLLESGVTDVSVVHRSGRATRWRFEAGPFQVWVKGTQFELDWQPATQSLSLTMHAGSVELSGACLPAPRLVTGGSSVRLSCAQAAPQLAPAPMTSAARPELTRGAAASGASAASQPRLHARKAAPVSFEASCETASKAALVAWANRERLAGSLARARSALLVLRRRFPGSSEAGTAAFTLGRMAFDQGADYGAAARWFAAYLAEQPKGPLMGDAAGRLLEAHERKGDRAAARGDAEMYLRRFPDGPYAARARRILAE